MWIWALDGLLNTRTLHNIDAHHSRAVLPASEDGGLPPSRAEENRIEERTAVAADDDEEKKVGPVFVVSLSHSLAVVHTRC